LKTLLKRIFVDNGFSINEIHNTNKKNKVFFAANYSNNAVNFYLVVFIEQITKDFLSQEVPEYYNAIKSLEVGYDERMDKNLSMLVCMNSDEIKAKELSEVIFEIEEDPYFFKKYVLSYTNSQGEQLRELFSDEKCISNILLNKIVNDSEKFSEFKNAQDNSETGLFEICSKIMIKLPFIRFIKASGQIEDLSLKIEEDLLNSSIFEFTKSILQTNIESENLIDDILVFIGGEE
jgi:hypothetical protein